MPRWCRSQRHAAWFLWLFVTLSGACTDEGAARSTLRGAGYTNIALTGYEFFSCGKDDGTCTGFEATGPTGVHVRGAVGCGFWSCSKACTIRAEAVQ